MWLSHQLPLCSGCRKHGNTAEAAQNQLSFMQLSIILVVLSCCISSWSFARWNKPVIDVFIWILASCQWSILLSCCEMKLLHAQLSPSSQAHRDKTLTKTCQLWVCGKAFQSESECVFKVKNPGRPPTSKIVRRNFTEIFGLRDRFSYSYCRNLSWEAAMSTCSYSMNWNRLHFFNAVHRGKHLDRRLKEMSVNICNTAAHLLLISNNEIPEWISRILGYSVLLNITAEWLVPDQLDHSPNNQVFVFHLIFLPEKLKWYGDWTFNHLPGCMPECLTAPLYCLV